MGDDGSDEHDELNEFTITSTRVESRLRISIICSLSLLYALKNLVYPWIMVTTIDYSNIKINGPNMRPINDNLYQTLCSRDNCTQFLKPDSGKTLDIRHFPVIPICYPNLSSIYPATGYLGPYALILHSLVSFIFLVLGVILPMSQMYYPCKCDPLMFLLAPNLTAQFIQLRIAEIRLEYKRSYEYYVEFMSEKRTFRLFTSNHYESILAGGRRRSNSINLVIQKERLKHAERAANALDAEPEVAQVPEKQSDELVLDYLPVIRSASWHPKAKLVFVKVLFVGITIALIEILFICYDLLKRFEVKRWEISLFVVEMIRSGCRHTTEIEPGKWQTIEPNFYKLEWTKWLILDAVFVLFLVPVRPTIAAIYYLMYCELTWWRNELKVEIEFINEITRLSLIKRRESEADRGNEVKQLFEENETFFYFPNKPKKPTTDSEVFCTTERVRHSFSHANHLDLAVLSSSGTSKTGCTIGRHERALITLPETGINLDFYLGLVEKTYVSFRLLIEHVQHCSDTTWPLAIVTYIMGYGTILITAWHSHLMRQFNSDHMIMVLVSCLWSLIMVALMSNFHAKVS